MGFDPKDSNYSSSEFGNDTDLQNEKRLNVTLRTINAMIANEDDRDAGSMIRSFMNIAFIKICDREGYQRFSTEDIEFFGPGVTFDQDGKPNNL